METLLERSTNVLIYAVALRCKAIRKGNLTPLQLADLMQEKQALEDEYNARVLATRQAH